MNLTIFQYLNGFAGRSHISDNIIIFFAQHFPYLVGVSMIFFLIFGKDKKREVRIIIFSFFSAIFARLVVTEIIRYLDNVSRPFVDNNVNQLIFHETSNSFPSGHAAFFFALATAIIFTTRWRTWGVVFFVCATLISVARVIAGIHWPLDILAGAIVGILTTLIIYSLFRKKLQKPSENI